VAEFDVLVAQLEHQHRLGELTMQKLWFFLQPSLITFSVLDAVVAAAGGVGGGRGAVGVPIGGALLNALHGASFTFLGGKAVPNAFVLFWSLSVCVCVCLCGYCCVLI
jgi:gamma-tubulin complex component 2